MASSVEAAYGLGAEGDDDVEDDELAAEAAAASLRAWERLDSSMCTVTSTLRLMLMSLKLNGFADGVIEGAGAGVGGMGTTVTFGREMITT